MASYLEAAPATLAESYVNINGELVPGDQAHVSVLDRNFLYGDGVFDGMPVYDGKVILANRHIDRFYRSLKAVKIDMPLEKDELRTRMVETLEASELRNGSVRLIVSRGLGPAGVVNTAELGEPTVVIIPQHTAPEDVAYGKGEPAMEKARVASTRTFSSTTIDPRIKSCNYLNNALAERELLGTDANFAIMLDHDGHVAEAFDANIFVEDHTGVIRTPPIRSVLGGITREIVMELAEERGYDVRESEMTTYDLLTAEELFMTSSGRGISSIVELDARPINKGEPGDSVRELAAALYDYVTEYEYLELDV